MKNVTAHNTNFKVATPQKFEDRIVNIQGSSSELYVNFFFITHQGERIEVASYNSKTKELKEIISGIVSID